MSYVNLHKKYLRATPKLFSLYQTAISYFEVMNERIYAREVQEVNNNMQSDRRNALLTFTRTNNYKIGLNLLSNRLRAITGCIPKNIMTSTKNQFKTYCKINIIQAKLSIM